jgi:hypothetical protein
MIAVPGRPNRAADQDAPPPINGPVETPTGSSDQADTAAQPNGAADQARPRNGHTAAAAAPADAATPSSSAAADGSPPSSSAANAVPAESVAATAVRTSSPAVDAAAHMSVAANASLSSAAAAGAAPTPSAGADAPLASAASSSSSSAPAEPPLPPTAPHIPSGTPARVSAESPRPTAEALLSSAESPLPPTESDLPLDAPARLSAESPRPATEVAPPAPSVDVAPAPSVDVAPAQSVDVAPLRTVDGAPAPSVDVAPLRTVDGAPPPTVDGAPPLSANAPTPAPVTVDPLAAANTPLALQSVNAEPVAAAADGPHLTADPGLYAVLGLDPSVADHQIPTAYRRQAARLLSNGATNTHAMRELNVAYEVLGNPVRRAEYDRLRLQQAFAPQTPTPIKPGAKAAARQHKRTRPRHAVQPRYAGLPDVLVVLMVVGLAVLAGALLIPRLSINLSALNAFQNVLPNTSRRSLDLTPTPAAASTPAAVPTVRPGVAERFVGSTVSVSDPTPAQNGQENVVIRLRRDGQPAANFDVWATVQYRTTQERWPATGAAKTDAAGAATIAFNIGSATSNYPVTVRVFAQVDDQQLSWSTTFTPR